jgi:hypothetical protein
MTASRTQHRLDDHLGGLRQSNDQRLNDLGQFRQRNSQSGGNNAFAVVSGQQRHANHAFYNFDIADLIEENLRSAKVNRIVGHRNVPLWLCSGTLTRRACAALSGKIRRIAAQRTAKIFDTSASRARPETRSTPRSRRRLQAAPKAISPLNSPCYAPTVPLPRYDAKPRPFAWSWARERPGTLSVSTRGSRVETAATARLSATPTADAIAADNFEFTGKTREAASASSVTKLKADAAPILRRVA